jgi:hypothetical protein
MSNGGTLRVLWGVAAILWLAFATTVRAQDTARTTRVDSLAERLRRAEEAIATLREQLATEAASGVKSASRVRVDIFGRVLMNAYSNSAVVNNADVPQFVVDDEPPGGSGGTIRQTSFGLAVSVERVLGGRFEGELATDFYGGQQPSSGGRRFPLLRIRTARGVVQWKRGEILFGQSDPLVAGVNPASVAAFGTPEFTASGNLWLWLPQLRATWVLWEPAGLAVQGAVLAPTTGDPVGDFDTSVDLAERSNRPFVQARLRAQWGPEELRGEIGVGVHGGWIRRADGGMVSSRAVAADAIIPLGTRVELRGEWYAGQALRGLGGGGVGQNLTLTGAAVDDRGGWGQLIVRPDSRWSLGSGCGVGDPKDVTGLPAGRLSNTSCAVHVTLRPDGPILVSLGWREQRTKYAAGTVGNTHLNVGVGFEF